MRSLKLWSAFLCAAATIASLALAVERGSSSTWRHDFQAAEAEARRLNRPLLVHFHAKWCGPCQMMNREVLSDAAVLRQLDSAVVAVKVDSDEHPELVQRFGITSLPTDLFLDPSGFVLDRTSGMSDRDRYLSLVARVDARFSQSQKTQIALETKPALRQPASLTRPTLPPIAPSPVRTPVDEPLKIATTTQPGAGRSGPARHSFSMVGLRGFSPVSLVSDHKWMKGSERWSCEHKGIMYYMTSAEELQQFKEDADRYAPQVLGCDPVILDITDRAISGDIRYAAFFDGELYLFVSDKSRQAFRQDPDRFVRTKHVLNIDDLEDKRLE
ncbi:MAG TPA: thioredoxin family protein [Planctomycetaceae bacterium]|nr:thioredoxin family protein [Planctomycetaceae bacterium]